MAAALTALTAQIEAGKIVLPADLVNLTPVVVAVLVAVTSKIRQAQEAAELGMDSDG